MTAVAAEVRAIADDLLAYQRDHGRKLDAAHIGFVAGRLMSLAERLEREDEARIEERAANDTGAGG